MIPTRSLIFAAALLAACGDGGNGPTTDQFGITATGPGVLSVSPLDTTTLFAATPLGQLSPPGHVLPTDHIYLMFVDPWSGQQQLNDCRARPVYAAGAGVINFVLVTESAGDLKVMVQMTKSFYYYYDHVLLLPNLGVGSRVNAGDQIATTTGRCPSIDLGVIDYDVNPPGFLNPARYGDAGRHAASPLRYFTPTLREHYLRKVRLFEGVPPNREGRIDFGVAGRLIGDWFHTSLPTDGSTSAGPIGWPKSLAFVPDWFDGTPRISIGGTIAQPGVLKTAPNDPDPANVTVASGVVAYQGTAVKGTIGAGWVLVQLLTDSRIRIEFFPGAVTRPTTFTSAAQEYVR